MTRLHYIIIALSLTVDVLLAVLLWPTDAEPLPPIQDETAMRIQVQREIRSLEVIPLKNDLKAALAKMDSLQKVTPKIKYRYHEQAVTNWSLSDSLSGALLLTRIRASVPDTH